MLMMLETAGMMKVLTGTLLICSSQLQKDINSLMELPTRGPCHWSAG